MKNRFGNRLASLSPPNPALRHVSLDASAYALRNPSTRPSLSEAERKKRLRGCFHEFIKPWKKRGRGTVSDRQFREGWKEFTKLYDSGAASLTVIVTEAHMLGDPLPDPVDFLRTFDRNRGMHPQL